MRFVYTAPRYHTNQHFPIKALLEAGHEVSFLALARGQSEEYTALSPTVLGYSAAYDTLRRLLGRCIGKNLVGIPEGGGIAIGGMPPVLKFWREMRRQRPSAVVVRDPLTAYGLLSILAARLTGARPVFYNQATKHRRLKLWKRLVHSFSLWAAGSQWMTPVLGTPDQHGPAFGRLHYVPFVIEPQTSPQEKRWFHRDDINILAIGKFQRRKNHRLFIEAVARLSQRYPIRATIIGECSNSDHQRELEDVRGLCKALGLEDRVDFKTNLPFAQVQEEYRKHDVFVLASRDEQAAVSHLEAMSHSLPVVCSESNGTQCYIRPGENGFIFRTDDLDDLTASIDKILRDRERLVEMGQRSYELVITEHSPERYVETLLSLAGPRR